MSDQNVSPATSAQVSVVLTCAAPGCRERVPASRKKYCKSHGEQASKLRKREVRRAEDAAYRAARKLDIPVQSPYLKGWPSREAYNAHYREAMRRSRARAQERANSNGSPTPAHASAA